VNFQVPTREPCAGLVHPRRLHPAIPTTIKNVTESARIDFRCLPLMI
jgi:hypothetical protein